MVCYCKLSSFCSPHRQGSADSTQTCVLSVAPTETVSVVQWLPAPGQPPGPNKFAFLHSPLYLPNPATNTTGGQLVLAVASGGGSGGSTLHVVRVTTDSHDAASGRVLCSAEAWGHGAVLSMACTHGGSGDTVLLCALTAMAASIYVLDLSPQRKGSTATQALQRRNVIQSEAVYPSPDSSAHAPRFSACAWQVGRDSRSSVQLALSGDCVVVLEWERDARGGPEHINWQHSSSRRLLNASRPICWLRGATSQRWLAVAGGGMKLSPDTPR